MPYLTNDTYLAQGDVPGATLPFTHHPNDPSPILYHYRSTLLTCVELMLAHALMRGQPMFDGAAIERGWPPIKARPTPGFAQGISAGATLPLARPVFLVWYRKTRPGGEKEPALSFLITRTKQPKETSERAWALNWLTAYKALRTPGFELVNDV